MSMFVLYSAVKHGVADFCTLGRQPPLSAPCSVLSNWGIHGSMHCSLMRVSEMCQARVVAKCFTSPMCGLEMNMCCLSVVFIHLLCPKAVRCPPQVIQWTIMI